MGSATIKSSFETQNPKDKKKKVGFDYNETKSGNKGGGPRGLKISEQGKSGAKEYDIEPNPHDNPKYNKKQAKFYEAAAVAVATVVLKDKDWDPDAKKSSFPKNASFTWESETYKLKG